MSLKKINQWALPHIKSFRTYIDVGANNGDTAIPFLDTFKHLIAFEPNPNTFEQIPESIEKYNVALTDYIGTTTLVVPDSTNNPEHGSIAKRRMENWTGDSFTVMTCTLDSYNFTEVDFIKIDVEQGELEVIKGAVQTIEKYKPVIMFENKRNENDSVIDILKDLGYNIIKHKSDTVAYYENSNTNSS